MTLPKLDANGAILRDPSQEYYLKQKQLLEKEAGFEEKITYWEQGTGKIRSIQYLNKDGLLQSPNEKVPAATYLDENGKPQIIQHYDNGYLHAPNATTPSEVQFYSNGMTAKEIYHCKNQWSNPAEDKAAVTEYGSKGNILAAYSYINGKEVTMEEANQAMAKDQKPKASNIAADVENLVDTHPNLIGNAGTQNTPDWSGGINM